MSTSYPASIDSFTAASGSDTLATQPHSTMHNHAADAIVALQTKLGSDASADTNSIDYKVNGNAYRKIITLREDFLAASTGQLAANSTGSGAGFSYNNAAAGKMGIVTCATGTATTGVARLGFLTTGVPGSIILGQGSCWFDTDINLSALSDGTDTYSAKYGFNDNVGGNDATDGVYFRYTHSANSGKFECVCRSNSTETAADSGITVAASTWYRLGIMVNAAGTSVTFYINGSSVATVTTNIPTGATRATSLGLTILKSLGSTSRSFDCDLVAATIVLTTER